MGVEGCRSKRAKGRKRSGQDEGGDTGEESNKKKEGGGPLDIHCGTRSGRSLSERGLVLEKETRTSKREKKSMMRNTNGGKDGKKSRLRQVQRRDL